MHGSYFHHLFLLCLWLLVKAPQLACDAVSISGQQDRAAANQCWQKCSPAANVSRSTAKAFESPETCYKECLKKNRSHQFAGNEKVRALSRRIKRDLNVSTNSTPISVEQEDNCREFLESKSFLPSTHVKIYLVARGPKFYYANISWNISSDITRNWTRGYLVLYVLETNKGIDIYCHRVLGMNTSFSGFDITDEYLTDYSTLFVMVFSLSQERGNPDDNDWKSIQFIKATRPSIVRTSITFQETTRPSIAQTGITFQETTRPSIAQTGIQFIKATRPSIDRTGIPTSAIVAMCVTFAFVVVAVVIWRRFVDKKTKEEDVALLDSGFKFDAFIIYSTTDETWVKEKLLSILEEKHNINCCIHYRDFLPGVPFIDNMAQSVYSSRKTIAVVSKSFLSSNYCNHELDLALHRLVERRDNSVIVIKLDDVEDSNLPIELQFRSYIDFTKATDRKTWEHKLVNSFIGERC